MFVLKLLIAVYVHSEYVAVVISVFLKNFKVLLPYSKV